MALRGAGVILIPLCVPFGIGSAAMITGADDVVSEGVPVQPGPTTVNFIPEVLVWQVASPGSVEPQPWHTVAAWSLGAGAAAGAAMIALGGRTRGREEVAESSTSRTARHADPSAPPLTDERPKVRGMTFEVPTDQRR